MTNIFAALRQTHRVSWPAAFAAAVLLGSVSSASAQSGQLGRGLPPFDWQTRNAYEFGFQPLFDVVLFNASDRTLYFEAASFTSAVRQAEYPGHAWEVPAGQIGRPEILARRLDAGFRTDGGRYVLVEPRFAKIHGRDVALYHVTTADVERTNRLPENEVVRANDFRLAMETNLARTAARTAARGMPTGDEPAPKFPQSIHRLRTDESLSRDVTDWLFIRRPRD
ncbi:MAG: hypothetical protein WD066_16205 [Planctomycetaceae bacterium]